MSLFTPAWKSDKEKKLKRALEAVEYEIEPTILEKIATTAPLKAVRLAALKKLTEDTTVLNVIWHSLNAGDKDFLEIAMTKPMGVAAFKKIALQCDDSEICLSAIDHIAKSKDKSNRNNALSAIAAAKIDTEIGDAALDQIESESQWAQAAIKSRDPKRRKKAVQWLNDEKLLHTIATGSDPDDIRLAAAEQIRKNKEKKNKRLAHSVLFRNDFSALDEITDSQILQDTIEQIQKRENALETLEKIVWQTKNETVKTIAEHALKSVKETRDRERINELHKTVLSESNHMETRYKAAVELVNKYYVTEAEDPALTDAIRKLLNSRKLDTTALLVALGRKGSNIDVVYPRLIDLVDDDSFQEFEILMNYPTPSTVTTLYEILASNPNQCYARKAGKILKKMYVSADEETKASIRKIPRKVYHSHYDQSGINCHLDEPEVSFFLD